MGGGELTAFSLRLTYPTVSVLGFSMTIFYPHPHKATAVRPWGSTFILCIFLNYKCFKLLILPILLTADQS